MDEGLGSMLANGLRAVCSLLLSKKLNGNAIILMGLFYFNI